jgi:hypothetical protein
MPTRQIDLTPNEGMRKAAEQGLEYRRKYGRGGTAVGIARARDIKNGKTLSPSTVRRMKAFFDRHEVNRRPPSEKKESDGGPTNGWIAWLLWGGDPGRTWAEAKVRQLNAEEDRVRHVKRSFSEEEKKALKLAFKAIEKMMEEEEEREEPVEKMEEAEEERPDHYGDEEERPCGSGYMKKKREDEEEMDEEERWLKSVMTELRGSK